MAVENESDAANISLKPATSKGSKRMIQLDVLRGVAVTMVLGTHFGYVIGSNESGYCRPLAEFLVRVGWSGVDLFFVLSGYLIGGLLFREIKLTGSLDVRRFVFRRGFKIWPLYYLYLGYCFVSYIVGHQHMTPTQALQDIAPNLLHIQNYVVITQRHHTWSLAVEEHFYLFLPFVLVLLTRKRALSLFPLVAASVAAACVLMRGMVVSRNHYIYVHTSDSLWHWYFPTHLRIDALFFGVVIAYFYHIHPDKLSKLAGSKRARWILAICGVMALIPVFWHKDTDFASHPGTMVVGLTMIYLGYGCILTSCIYNRKADGTPGMLFSIWPAKALAYIGFYSYAIYLWHVDIARDRAVHFVRAGHLDRMDGGTRWLVAFTLYYAVAVIVGIAANKAVETPMLKLRDRVVSPGEVGR